MKYNYTDTFRSTLELASDCATRYGAAEQTLEYLLAGILQEGTSSAIRFFSQRQLPWQALLQELLDHFELMKPKEAEKYVPPYSVDAHNALTKAAHLSTLLGAEAISPLHLLYALYFFEGWDYLRVYCETFGYTIATDRELEQIALLLGQETQRPRHRPLPEASEEESEEDDQQEDDQPEESRKKHKTRRRGRRNEVVPVAAFSIGPDGKFERNDRLLQDVVSLMRMGARPVDDDLGEQPPREEEAATSAPEDDPRLLLEEVGRFLPGDEKEAVDATPLYATEMMRITETLMRQRCLSPILIGELQDSPEEVVRAYARALYRREHGGTTGFLPPQGFPYTEILQVTPARLLAGAQMFGPEMIIRTLSDRLRLVPTALLYIPDVHLLRPSNARGQGGELADLLFSGLAQHGIRLLATATSAGYAQSIERSELVLRTTVKVTIEPIAETLHEPIYRELVQQVRRHYRVQPDFSFADVRLLLGRYLPQRPFFYASRELLDLAGAFARQRRGRLAREGAPVHLLYRDLYQAVARLANIPVEQVSGESEVKELQRLPTQLKAKIIGQDHAIDLVSRSIQRAKLGLRDPQRPIASFLFLGPTGVGKTYLAKALAREVFGSEEALVRIDMSEFTERFAISRLIGPPPGYIGFGEGGELTEPVRTQPHRLILLDEIEKAHPDIYNLLLQLLDDGRLTDSEGRTVDFRHTLIILTSNVGSREAKSFARSVGFAGIEETQPRGEGIVRKALERTFSPEFLGRLDETIAFNSLGDEALEQIVSLELAPIIARLAASGYTLEVLPEARQLLARADEAKSKGARFIRRRLQTLIEDRCVEAILSGELTKGARCILGISPAGGLQHTIESADATVSHTQA